MKTSATFSKCRQYRYQLERIWGSDDNLVLFILLNPSTADETNNDPTIRRCLNFAKSWQFNGLLVGNLFAYRTPNPKQLVQAQSPIGRANNKHLLCLATRAQKIVLAWGNHGQHSNRAKTVLELLKDHKLYSLGLTDLNQPKHPLYLSKDTQLQPIRD